MGVHLQITIVPNYRALIRQNNQQQKLICQLIIYIIDGLHICPLIQHYIRVMLAKTYHLFQIEPTYYACRVRWGTDSLWLTENMFNHRTASSLVIIAAPSQEMTNRARKDPLAVGSDTILRSWPVDRIPQISNGSLDRENTKSNRLLPIESWHKSFTGKFVIEITWLWFDQKTPDWWYLFMTSQLEVWRRHLWVPIREPHGQLIARTQCLLTIQQGLEIPYLTDMCLWLTSLKICKLLAQESHVPVMFPVVCGS